MPIAVNLPRKQETQPARENLVREQYIREDSARGVASNVAAAAAAGDTATAAVAETNTGNAAVAEANTGNTATAHNATNAVNNIAAARVPATNNVVRPILPVSAVSTALRADENDSEGETMLRLYTDKSRGFTVTRLRDGKAITVHATRATIGRSKTADIHMGGNTNVSRIHAVIDMLDDGRFASPTIIRPTALRRWPRTGKRRLRICGIWRRFHAGRRHIRDLSYNRRQRRTEAMTLIAGEKNHETMCTMRQCSS